MGSLGWGEMGGHGVEGAGEGVGCGLVGFDVGVLGDGGGEHLEDGDSSFVEGVEWEVSLAGDHFEGWVEKGDVPTGIAAGVFVIAGEEAALGVVDVVVEIVEGGVDGDGLFVSDEG